MGNIMFESQGDTAWHCGVQLDAATSSHTWDGCAAVPANTKYLVRLPCTLQGHALGSPSATLYVI